MSHTISDEDLSDLVDMKFQGSEVDKEAVCGVLRDFGFGHVTVPVERYKKIRARFAVGDPWCLGYALGDGLVGLVGESVLIKPKYIERLEWTEISLLKIATRAKRWSQR